MLDIEIELKSLRSELDRLKVKEHILQQLVRYGRGQEWLDASLLDEVFFEDAAIDFGFFKGLWRDYRPVLMEIERNSDSTYHLCGPPQIEFEGDERANVECYGLAGGRTKGVTQIFGGRYFHIFERRLGLWKSASCTYVMDWSMKQVEQAEVAGALGGINTVRDRSAQHPLFRRMGYDLTG